MAKKAFIITGDKKLNRALFRLEKTEAKKIVRKAAREALRPVLSQAKANAPEDTGRLVASLKIRALKRSRKRFGATVQTAAGNFQGETYYGGFQEWGWVARSGNKIPGDRFMLRAAITERQPALRIYRRLISNGIIGAAKS